MSSNLSFSLSAAVLAFYLSFSVNIFWRYSFSCLLFSRSICLSWSISLYNLLTRSTSCLNYSLSSTFFLCFSSYNCLSRELFSCIIFLFISYYFSISLSSSNLMCCSCSFSYILFSSDSLCFLCFFSYNCFSNSSLINLFLSLSLRRACFCSS